MWSIEGFHHVALDLAPVLTGEHLSAKPHEARARPGASFSKEERARDGAEAMMEYLANGRMVRERMAQLRALRLAKEAVDKKAELAKSVAGKRQGSKAQQGS